MIKLENNKSFKWYYKDKVYGKGYVYDNNKTICGTQLCEFFKQIFLENNTEKLKTINGCFSCVINFDNNIYLISDRIASFPLYYTLDGRYISDSLDTIKKELKDSIVLDDGSIIELMASSYITENKTAYKEIRIVDLGQYINIQNNKINSNYYFKHLNHGKEKESYEKLEKEYNSRNNKIFKNLIDSLGNKTAVIPLSGGYDSRYIACMLKEYNYDNVICYTYGDKNTYEVEYSKMVAEKLGYKWFFIEYTEEEWEKVFNEKFMQYCNFSHNYISIPHIQDYIALKKLKEENVIDDTCIIINGFCGDLPAGSFLLNKSDCRYVDLGIEWITNYIYNQNYNHINVNKKNKRVLKGKIENHIMNLGLECNNFEDFMKIYEEWFTGARPCKWVVNSNRIYEFFGMEWRMPLWDNEFIDFFYNLDYENRVGCKFYQKYIFDKLFIPYEVDFIKPEYTDKKTLKYEYSIVKKVKKIILHILNYTRIITGKVIVKRNDLNSYTNLAIILSRKIKNKRVINMRTINAHQMMAIWWCEYKYGKEYIKAIWKGSNKK